MGRTHTHDIRPHHIRTVMAGHNNGELLYGAFDPTLATIEAEPRRKQHHKSIQFLYYLKHWDGLPTLYYYGI